MASVVATATEIEMEETVVEEVDSEVVVAEEEPLVAVTEATEQIEEIEIKATAVETKVVL